MFQHHSSLSLHTSLVTWLLFGLYTTALAVDLVRSGSPRCSQPLCNNFSFTLSYNEVEKCYCFLALRAGYHRPHMNLLECYLINNKCPFLSTAYNDKFSLLFSEYVEISAIWWLVGAAHLRNIFTTKPAAHILKCTYYRTEDQGSITFLRKMWKR